MNRSTLIVSAALMALLIAEFVWLELRERRKNRKGGGRKESGPSAHHVPRGNGEGGRR